MDTQRSFHIGPIRPPSEASSLLLQITNGCTWNRCKFCNLYRHTAFKAYRVEDIKADIDNMRAIADRVESHRVAVSASPKERSPAISSHWDLDGINFDLGTLSGDEQQCYYMVANWLIGGGKNVFLQDGNSLILSGGKLTEVLYYLREKFPTIERITSYGRAHNLAKLSPQDYRELKEAGLSRIHSGFETGSDAVLKLVNKGTTSEEQITAGRNIKEGGIELSVYYMPGLGGKELSRDNALGTARVVNACGPDFVRLRTAAVKPGTELYEDLKNGAFTLTGDDDKIREIRAFVESAGFDGKIVSDHIINLLPEIQGHCGKDKARMLEVIDEYLNLSDEDRRLYQLARRSVMVESVSQMKLLGNDQLAALRDALADFSDSAPAEWDEKTQAAWDLRMNELISRYI